MLEEFLKLIDKVKEFEKETIGKYFEPSEPITIEYFPELSDDIKNKLKNFQLEDIKHDTTMSYDCVRYMYYLEYTMKDLLYKYRTSRTTFHEVIQGWSTLKKKKRIRHRNCDPTYQERHTFISVNSTEPLDDYKQFIWTGKDIQEELILDILSKKDGYLIESIDISKLLSNTRGIIEFYEKMEPFTTKYSCVKDDITFEWKNGLDYRINFIDVYKTI